MPYRTLYTEKALYDIQGNNIEESLWVSIRMLEERRNLIKSMAQHSETGSGLSIDYRENLHEIEKHIHSLKYVLRTITGKKGEEENA